MLLYAHNQRLIRDYEVDHFGLQLAQQSHQVLVFCAASSDTARYLSSRLSNIIVHFQFPSAAPAFFSPPPASPAEQGGDFLLPVDGSSARHTIQTQILALLCEPFAGTNSGICLQDTATSLEEICVGGHLNWCGLFSRGSDITNKRPDFETTLSEEKDADMLPLQQKWLEGLQEGKGIGEHDSHGWRILPE